MPAMAATGNGSSSESAGRRNEMATHAAMNPTAPSSQPMIACHPGVRGTGGRSTLREWTALSTTPLSPVTLSRPDGTTMTTPMRAIPPTMTALVTHGLRERRISSASAMPSRPATPA